MKPKFSAFFKALLLFAAVQLLFSSCSSEDEPEVLVNYYLALDSPEIIGLSEEEANGSLRPPQEHNAYLTYIFMKRALRKAYPEASPQGNDARVIAVCDSCYRQSFFYYSNWGETICSIKLMRVTQLGDHVVNSRQLKFYKLNRY